MVESLNAFASALIDALTEQVTVLHRGGASEKRPILGTRTIESQTIDAVTGTVSLAIRAAESDDPVAFVICQDALLDDARAAGFGGPGQSDAEAAAAFIAVMILEVLETRNPDDAGPYLIGLAGCDGPTTRNGCGQARRGTGGNN
jgi:hypothetical protein